MNRPIKYRAWDSISKVMHEWVRIHNIPLGELIALQHYDLMQYTGLKDKNGIEIYERDKLLYCKTNVGVVKICPIKGIYAEGYECHISPESFITCKIIGNIYENPELINN